MDRCIGGLEQACVPGAPEDEACNDLDDDCDGVVDVADRFEVHLHESNDSCSAQTDLGSMRAPVTGFSVSSSPTLYPGGDADYYQILAQEPTDAFWECLPLVCEERYRVTISLSRPPDGADYQLCASASSCGSQTCTGGDSLELTFSGSCGGTDDRMIYFSVRSPSGESFDCHAYDVSLSFSAWLVTASWPGCPGA